MKDDRDATELYPDVKDDRDATELYPDAMDDRDATELYPDVKDEKARDPGAMAVTVLDPGATAVTVLDPDVMDAKVLGQDATASDQGVTDETALGQDVTATNDPGATDETTMSRADLFLVARYRYYLLAQAFLHRHQVELSHSPLGLCTAFASDFSLQYPPFTIHKNKTFC